MTPPASSREAAPRVDIIQVLRGLASLVVMFGHLVTATDFKFPLGLSAFSAYPSIGVFVFFTISGFVVPWSLWSQRYEIRMFPRYMARRLLRLDPPYFVMVAVGVAIAVYRSRAHGTPMPYDATTIALHLGYLAGLMGRPWVLDVFWTLGIEFLFYIVMGLLYPLLSRIPDWMASVTTTRATVPTVTAQLPRPPAVFVWLAISVLLTMAPTFIASKLFHAYFLLGFLIFAVKALGLHWGYVASYCFVMGNFATMLPVEWAIVSACAALTLTLPDRLSWLTTTRLGAIAAGLGNISYSLYLTHPVIVGTVTSRAIRRGWLNGPLEGVAVFVIESALCLTVAVLFYHAVERPAVRLSHRVALRVRPAAR